MVTQEIGLRQRPKIPIQNRFRMGHGTCGVDVPGDVVICEGCCCVTSLHGSNGRVEAARRVDSAYGFAFGARRDIRLSVLGSA